MFDNIKKLENGAMMREVWDIPTSNNCKIDFYGPANYEKPFKSFIFIHGGGLYNGSKSGLPWWSHDFIKLGYGFFSIDYSLYPNAKFPIYLEECASEIKFIFDNCSKYGASGEIYIIGESAGGWITLMLLSDKSYFKNIEFDDKKIKGYITECASSFDEIGILQYEMGLDPMVTRVSKYAPLFYVNKDFKSAPILLIANTEDQFLNRCESNQVFYNQVKYFSDTDITLLKLLGDHCQCGRPNNDGSYDFTKIVLNWLKNH